MRSLYIRILYLSGLLWWAKSRIARDGVIVLTLHRVLPGPNFDQVDCQTGMLVRDTTFDGLLAYLRRHCECVPLLPAAGSQLRNGFSSKVRVAVTFDDGWRDNYETALPLANKYQVPMTVFVCPGFIENREAFWPASVVTLWRTAERTDTLAQLRELWRATVPTEHSEQGDLDDLMDDLKPLDASRRNAFIGECGKLLGNGHEPSQNGRGSEFLSWDEVKEMAGQGVTFGSHTDTHCILPNIPAEQAHHELQVSKALLESRLNCCSLLSYPNGDWSESVRKLAVRSGYTLAFANSPGVWTRQTDPLSVPRVNIWEGKLSGANGKFSRLEFEYAAFWLSYRM